MSANTLLALREITDLLDPKTQNGSDTITSIAVLDGIEQEVIDLETYQDVGKIQPLLDQVLILVREARRCLNQTPVGQNIED